MAGEEMSQTNGPPLGIKRGVNWRGVAQVIVGVGALAFVIASADARGIAEAIRNTRVAYLPIAVAASFVVIWLMAYRWKVILHTRGQSPGTGLLFGCYLIASFFTNFVPGGSASGDLARFIYVDRMIRDKAFVLSSLVYERLVGMFTLLLVGLVATLISHGHVQTTPIYIAEAVFALAFIAISMLMSESISRRVAGVVESVANRLRVGRIGAGAARTILATSELRRRKGLLARTIAISIAVRLVWSAGCYVVSRAIGLPLSITLVFAFISLADLIRLMPVSVGGLGVREWVLVGLLAGVGIGREQALAFSLLVFAPLYLNAIAGGIFYISQSRLRKQELVAEPGLGSSSG